MSSGCIECWQKRGRRGTAVACAMTAPFCAAAVLSSVPGTASGQTDGSSHASVLVPYCVQPHETSDGVVWDIVGATATVAGVVISSESHIPGKWLGKILEIAKVAGVGRALELGGAAATLGGIVKGASAEPSRYVLCDSQAASKLLSPSQYQTLNGDMLKRWQSIDDPMAAPARPGSIDPQIQDALRRRWQSIDASAAGGDAQTVPTSPWLQEAHPASGPSTVPWKNPFPYPLPSLHPLHTDVALAANARRPSTVVSRPTCARFPPYVPATAHRCAWRGLARQIVYLLRARTWARANAKTCGRNKGMPLVPAIL
jgi:hypothetical protein